MINDGSIKIINDVEFGIISEREASYSCTGQSRDNDAWPFTARNANYEKQTRSMTHTHHAF